MKLVGQRERGVQSLGTHDVSGPGREWAAESRAGGALTGLVQGAAGFVQELENVRQDEEARDRGYAAQEKARSVIDQLENTENYDLSDPGQLQFLSGAQEGLNLADGQGGTRTLVNKHEVMSRVWDIQRRRIMEDANQGMTPRQKKYLDNMLGQEFAGMDRRITNGQVLATNNHVRFNVQQDVDTLVEQGQLGQALDLIYSSEQFTEAEKNKLADKASFDNEMNRIEVAIAEGGPNADAWIQALQDPNYEGRLSRTQRNAVVRDLKRSIIEKEAYETAASWGDRARANRELTLAASNGTLTSTAVANASDAGLINWQQEAQFNRQILAESRRRVNTAKASADLSKVLSDEEPPCMDKSCAKQIQKATAEIFPDTPESRGYLEDVAIKSSVVPKNLVQSMAQAVAYGTNQEAEAAVATYNRVKAGNPYAPFKMNKDRSRLLQDMSVMAKNGTPLPEAIKVTREIANLDPTVREAREKSLKGQKVQYGTYLQDRLTADGAVLDQDDMFGMTMPWAEDPPEIPPLMSAQFAEQVQQHYVRTGNEDLAKQVAYDDITNMWAVSSVGAAGRENVLKRLPPERVLGVPPIAIKKSLTLFAVSQGLEADRIDLVADRLTAAGEPSWVVSVHDDAGMPHIHRNRYNPLDWRLSGEAKAATDLAELQHRYDMRAELRRKLTNLEQKSQQAISKHPLYGADYEDEKADLQLRLEGFSDLDEDSEGPLAKEGETREFNMEFNL